MKSYSWCAIILICWGLMSCQGKVIENESDIVARFNDRVLTKQEVNAKMPKNYFPEDSVEIAMNLVNNWIRDLALLDYAESNLTDEQKDFTKQLTDYRNSLVIYAYERKLINQKLDTNITDAEIRDYYESNISNFKLQSYIVKARFVKVSDEAPKQEKLENWFKSESEKDFEKLYEYCTKYAENYYFKDEDWLYLEDLTKEVPFQASDWGNFLRENAYIKINSGSFNYLVRFFAYKLKDDTSPLSFERSRIRDLILNKRKVELINRMREDVVKKAFQNQQVQLSNF